MATTCNCNELTTYNYKRAPALPLRKHQQQPTKPNDSFSIPSRVSGLALINCSMALNFLRPGVPGMQPVGDLGTAKSAILFGVINGLFSPPVLELCLCTGGGGRPCDGDDDVEQRYYQLANFVLAMLGVALLFVDMALARAVLSSPLWAPMVRWMVWLTKALTCGTLQFGVNLLYFCVRMLCARFMLVFA